MKVFIKLMSFAIVALQSCLSVDDDDFILIKGGSFVMADDEHGPSEVYVSDFYIGKYEVTQSVWEEVMAGNPSAFKGADLPVEMVSWYDCIEFCNRLSILEGLEPYYLVIKEPSDPVNFNELDSVKWRVEVNVNSVGYRLPTGAEWEYAARGGIKNRIFSGSNNINEVAWYWRNSGREYLEGDWTWTAIEENQGRTHEVGKKRPNSWGLYDMSGNVREWCWDWYEDKELAKGYGRVWRGGGWLGGEHACAVSYRGLFEASGKGPDQGLRLVRSAN